MWNNFFKSKGPSLWFHVILLLTFVLNECSSYPTSPGEEYKYLDREISSPGAHQLASWLTSQLRRDLLPAEEMHVIPYRLPLQGKRNSEVTNAIIGSEETQKMYRDGRK